MAALLDVNMLVALLHGGHPHSEIATRWLETQVETGSVLVCRVTQMGALRILTKPSIMRENVLTPRSFWRGWELAMSDDRLRFEAEPPGLDAVWRTLTESLPEGSSAETDAYLAAFAISGGWTLCTLDRGFRRFPGLTAEYPE